MVVAEAHSVGKDKVASWILGRNRTNINLFQVSLVLEQAARLRSTRVSTPAPPATSIGSQRSLASRPGPLRRSPHRTGAPSALPTAVPYPSLQTAEYYPSTFKNI